MLVFRRELDVLAEGGVMQLQCASCVDRDGFVVMTEDIARSVRASWPTPGAVRRSGRFETSRE